MKRLYLLKSRIAFVLFIFIISCTGSGNKNQQTTAETALKKNQEPVKINAKAQALLDYLNETGDYVNSRNFPSLINASLVYEELDGNIKIIDLRDSESFKKGHIKNAVNIAFSELPEYFANKINPDGYDKIVMVCYAGQISSYATMLLRLMKYGNVFSMKWGMSGWNKDFAHDWWLKNISGDYEGQLEKTDEDKDSPNDLPILSTDKSAGKEVMDAQIKNIFENGIREAMISADTVFKDPQKYYIINFIRRDKYESGHIPGAIRYKPKGTLGIESEMETIPANKNIVVYCETGHNSSFVTAYLRLFGYNAHSLIYGNNAFMHNKMLAEKYTLSWSVLDDSEIENYPYVK